MQTPFILLIIGLLGVGLAIGSVTYASKTDSWNKGGPFAGFLLGVCVGTFCLLMSLFTYDETRTGQLIEERYGVEVLDVDDPVTYLRGNKTCTADVRNGGPNYILVNEDCEATDEIPREDELGKN
jgi:hypothetical protein